MIVVAWQIDNAFSICYFFLQFLYIIPYFFRIYIYYAQFIWIIIIILCGLWLRFLIVKFPKMKILTISKLAIIWNKSKIKYEYLLHTTCHKSGTANLCYLKILQIQCVSPYLREINKVANLFNVVCNEIMKENRYFLSR